MIISSSSSSICISISISIGIITSSIIVIMIIRMTIMICLVLQAFVCNHVGKDIRDSKDRVYPFFESDSLFIECVVDVFSVWQFFESRYV